MPRHLLIAEDSRTQREVLRAHLEDAGYRVSAAADGRQALEQLAQQRVDMLISDIVMPGMDGYELCRQAKKRNPRLPVILLTSMTDPLDVVHGLQAGADNFLRKPYDFGQLRTRIETMLHNYELRESGQTQMGLELFFLEQRFMITAERQQILDLLVSTFEDLVVANEQMRRQEGELSAARDELARQLADAQAQRGRLAAVLDAVPEAMVVVDAGNTITDASENFARLVGVSSVADLRGRPTLELLRLRWHTGEELTVEECPVARALQLGQPVQMGHAFDLLLERRDGDMVPVLVTAAPVTDGDGGQVGAVGVVRELDAVSLHDPVTRLPTHSTFAQLVDAAVDVSADHDEVAAVAVVVVDRAQEIRDLLGKERSDVLVASLAERLQDALALPSAAQYAADASLGYLGDSEFALVLPRLAEPGQGVLVAEVVREHLRGPHQLGDLELSLTFTVGVTATGQRGTRAEALVPAAASAAHRGSRSGGDRVAASDPDAMQRAAGRLRDEADLRRGIENGELEVYYQPVMWLGASAAGVEALVRWHHPERGFRSPAEFIPLAEETGLVVPLGWEVLRQACAQAARWRAELPGAENLVVAVNLSPQQLAQGDVAERVQAALAESGLDAHGLGLEITEAGVVHECAIEQLSRLRSLGVGIGIDDFGTGYSSLLQLRRLPVDLLKVDREFVAGLLTDPDDATIVSASIRLAQALRLKVVAEGVESWEQAEELRRLGCEFGQGFLWSRPRPASELEQWWVEQSAAGAGAPGSAAGD